MKMKRLGTILAVVAFVVVGTLVAPFIPAE